MNGWISQLGYAWRRHGPSGFLKLAIDNVLYHVSCRAARVRMPPQLDPFDEKYGTDTGGIREIRTLDAAKLPSACYAVRYGPSAEEGVRIAGEGEHRPQQFHLYRFRVRQGQGAADRRGPYSWQSSGSSFHESFTKWLFKISHDFRHI